MLTQILAPLSRCRHLNAILYGRAILLMLRIFITINWHDVGNEAFVTRYIVTSDYDSLPDRRMLSHDSFDFTALDAITSDFHLVIRSPEVFKPAIRPPARAITGPV
jgi:hypothetical protein